MERFLQSIKAPFHTHQHEDIDQQYQRDLNHYHFRKQRGVNLGSWFVLERWIVGAPFQDAPHPAQSDLDVALGHNAKDNLERHWDAWIQTADWDWIAEHGFNSVRIPVGYYHLCGPDPSVLRGTDFEPHHHVYEGAWKRITWAIEEASKRSIGVLIDLHAAPGKQNHDAHAGTSYKPNFFGDIYNRNKTTHVLISLVNALNTFTGTHDPPLRNIIGIELINEPDANPLYDPMLKDWYGYTIHEIRKIDPTIPLYIGECWRPDSFADFVANLPSSSKSGPVVLDHHLYRCFTSSDIRTSVKDHIHNLTTTTKSSFTRLNERLGRSGGGLIVGEWSGGLNEGSMTSGTVDERRAYIDTQLRLFEEECGGWFFWTYKKDDQDPGWSLRGAVEQGAFPGFVGMRRVDDVLERLKAENENLRTQALRDAFGRHVGYWSKIPGSYQHAFFETGFGNGWDEAMKFISSTPKNSKTVVQIGFKGSVAKYLAPRAVEGSHYWEYEHGFIQGAIGAEQRYQASIV